MNVINVSMTACILTFNECMDFVCIRHECALDMSVHGTRCSVPYRVSM